MKPSRNLTAIRPKSLAETLYETAGGPCNLTFFSRPAPNCKRPSVYYHLILTDNCNLCCTYCRGKAFVVDPPELPDIAIDEDLPVDLEVDPADLDRFLAKDPDAVLTLYGGEPLLAIDLVRRSSARRRYRR
jgi:sulfatase maturation enzyme AslB (radical SAM superfamily)